MKYLLLIIALLCNTCNAGEPKEAIIPFATEAYTAKYLRPDEVEWIKKSADKKNDPSSVTYSNLADHLVESHKCPRWVVDLYSPDPVLLWRIHEGYELESLRNEFKEKKETPVDLRAYYAKMRSKYEKDFKMMKVKLGQE